MTLGLRNRAIKAYADSMQDRSSRLAADEAQGGASRTAQVLQFRPRQHAAQSTPAAPDATEPDDGALLDDLSRYEQDREEEPVNYARRMLMNIIAIAVVAVLMIAGVWLADTISQMERDQDCVLQGRHNCAPIEVPAALPR
jgi:hypothetical protein